MAQVQRDEPEQARPPVRHGHAARVQDGARPREVVAPLRQACVREPGHELRHVLHTPHAGQARHRHLLCLLLSLLLHGLPADARQV